MCSTPRPKSQITSTKFRLNGSLLSNISHQARSNFAKRANIADNRRYQQQTQRFNKTKHSVKRLIKKTKAPVKKDWRYWLVSANFKELVTWLFVGHVEKHNTVFPK